MALMIQGIKGWFCAALVMPSLLLAWGGTVQAQPLPVPAPEGASATPSPACLPPGPGEYLLLVVTRTPESQTQVQQLLPPNTSVLACSYLNDTVTRVGGFRTVDRANAWARYITDTTGLAAYVARPAENPSQTAVAGTTGQSPIPPVASTSTPGTKPAEPGKTAANTATPSASGYRPQPLGPGYAVLVDYLNQPDIAMKVQQVLGRPAGIVSYSQRPYLLALYTTDQNAANAALQALSDRGFWTTLVDGRRVVLLRQSVAGQ